MRRAFLAVSAMSLILFCSNPSHASEGFEDLVKVVRAGVTQEALLTYINESPMAYTLTVDEILYLSDLGLSAEVITAVVEHGKPPTTVPPAADPTDDDAAPPEPPPPETDEEAPLVAPDTQGADDVVQETVIEAPLVTAPPQESLDYTMFYDGLSPYGTWMSLDGGWYWQPTASVVVRTWRPYCDAGRWIHTDWGWMWQSSYSWGWAPFHYGRWRQHHRHGWIWQPDPVWAPAWVTWRHSDTAIGWAPLPPDAYFSRSIGFTYQHRRADDDCEFGLERRHYTFVPVLDFNSRAVGRHRLPGANVTQLFGTTTVIRNSLTISGQRLIVQGPDVARLRERTHQDVRPVRIADSAVRPGGRIVSGVVAGDSIMMYRPQLAPTARETPRAVVARRQANAELRRAVIARGTAVNTYTSGSEVRFEQIRGSTSRDAIGRPAQPPPPPRPAPSGATIRMARDGEQRNEALAAAARRRQAEEAAAHQQQGEQQRAAAFARQQAAQRRQAEAARNTQAAAQQQEQTRQATREQATRQVELLQRVQAQKQAQLATQRQQAQLRAIQAQRQADETAARLRETVQQHMDNASRQQSGLRGYENRSATSGDSRRGASSRSVPEAGRNR